MHFLLTAKGVVVNPHKIGYHAPKFKVTVHENIIEISSFIRGECHDIFTMDIGVNSYEVGGLLDAYSKLKEQSVLIPQNTTSKKIRTIINEALLNCVLWIIEQQLNNVVIRTPEFGKDFSKRD
jgi:hypothetical protein